MNLSFLFLDNFGMRKQMYKFHGARLVHHDVRDRVVEIVAVLVQLANNGVLVEIGELGAALWHNQAQLDVAEHFH